MTVTATTTAPTTTTTTVVAAAPYSVLKTRIDKHKLIECHKLTTYSDMLWYHRSNIYAIFWIFFSRFHATHCQPASQHTICTRTHMCTSVRSLKTSRDRSTCSLSDKFYRRKRKSSHWIVAFSLFIIFFVAFFLSLCFFTHSVLNFGECVYAFHYVSFLLLFCISFKCFYRETSCL